MEMSLLADDFLNKAFFQPSSDQKHHQRAQMTRWEARFSKERMEVEEDALILELMALNMW